MTKKSDSFQFGGMAVIEGVMMRSLNFWSVAVRAASGEILLRTEPVEKTWIFRQKWLKLPFLRGSLALLDTMFLGSKAMRHAGDIAADERFMPLSERTPTDKKAAPKSKEALVAGAVIAGLVIGFAIFDVGPAAIAQGSAAFLGFNGLQANIVEEVLKLALFLGYLLLIRRFPPILEVFRYHGAEHAAINAMEKGLPLTPENCLASSRFHLRCGTNFAIMVILIGFLVFIPLPRDLIVGPNAPHWLVLIARVLIRLMVLPLIAGISYEIIRAAGKAKDPRLLKFILTPGLATQLITTEVPFEKHAEVALAALKAVEQAEQGGELINSDVEKAAEESNARILAAGSGSPAATA
jgi:uncharacterized protein YqhQ